MTRKQLSRRDFLTLSAGAAAASLLAACGAQPAAPHGIEPETDYIGENKKGRYV